MGNLNLCGIKALKPQLSHAGNSIECTLEYHSQTTLSYLMLLLRRLDTAITLNPKNKFIRMYGPYIFEVDRLHVVSIPFPEVSAMF